MKYEKPSPLSSLPYIPQNIPMSVSKLLCYSAIIGEGIDSVTLMDDHDRIWVVRDGDEDGTVILTPKGNS